MSAINEFIKILKQRDNISKIGTVVGIIISVTPLKIDLGIGIFISKENMIVANSLFNNELKIGDKVIVVASENNDNFFIIDKVG